MQRALAGVRGVYREVVAEMAEALDWEGCGSANWLGMYHPHFINTIQSDISCMLGPTMFREFEVPNLTDQAACYDVVVYHPDGPGAVKHLPDICSVPGIEVIQYVPVPRETPQEVAAVYRAIDAQGKGIVRDAVPGEVPALWAASTTKRLILNVGCTTREEAEVLLAEYGYGR